VISIFLIALTLRWVFLFSYREGEMLKNINRVPDGVVYEKMALNFLKGKGLLMDSTYVRRPPVYPLFLAVIYYFTNHSLVTVRFIQGLIGALSCVIICFIGKEIFDGKTGLIAGLIASIDYSMLQLSAYLISETLYIFLFLAGFLFIVRYYKNQNLLNLAWAGIFVGLTALCRELGIFLALLAGVWLLWALDKDLRSRFKAITIFLIFCLLPVIPWTVRNYRIYHQFLPISASSGHYLYSGNNELTIAYIGGYDTPPIVSKEIASDELFTPRADEILKRKAINFMLTYPKKTLSFAKDKFINMWQPHYSDASRLSKIVMVFSYFPILILGLAGIITSLKKTKASFLVLEIIFFYALLHMFTLSGIRYRYPLIPLFIIYTAFILHRLSAKSKPKFT
jgi:4-amino-4-deoxy-L-arabinose transferase-like glycosyltransferase